MSAKFASPELLLETLRKAIPELRVNMAGRTLVMEGTADLQGQATKLFTALDVQGAGERVVRAVTLKYLHPHQVSHPVALVAVGVSFGFGEQPHVVIVPHRAQGGAAELGDPEQ